MAEDQTSTEAAATEHQDLDSALSRLIDHVDYSGRNVEKITMHVLQSGDLTYRVWVRGQDEPEGGYIGPLNQG